MMKGPLSELDTLTSPVVSRLTEKVPGRMVEYPERKMCISGKDAPLKIF
jgi:hypothetical protein